MAVYRFEFTPSGPYFFGNEKTFAFVNENSNAFGKLYYIKGERTPLQTTLLGAIRYFLLSEKSFAAAANSAAVIGSQSFDLESKQLQSFGAIRRLSALFLCKGEEWFVPTPFDHNGAAPVKKENRVLYTPFATYFSMETCNGPALYTPDYDPKYYGDPGYMSLDDGHIEADLFATVTRIGINRVNTKDGFFKKEYICLKPGFSFAILAEIEDGTVVPESGCVTLGQNKVPFAVKTQKTSTGIEALQNRTARIISELRKSVIYPDGENYQVVYCLSDAVVEIPDGRDINALYENSIFAITKTRDFRNFKTKTAVAHAGVCANAEKSAVLNRSLRAGSLFLVKPEHKLPCLTDVGCVRIANASLIGFNQLA